MPGRGQQGRRRRAQGQGRPEGPGGRARSCPQKKRESVPPRRFLAEQTRPGRSVPAATVPALLWRRRSPPPRPPVPVRESGNRRGRRSSTIPIPWPEMSLWDATARRWPLAPDVPRARSSPRKERPARRSKSPRPAGEENGQEKRPSHPPKGGEAGPPRPEEEHAGQGPGRAGRRERSNGRGKGPGCPSRGWSCAPMEWKDSTEPLLQPLMKPYHLER